MTTEMLMGYAPVLLINVACALLIPGIIILAGKNAKNQGGIHVTGVYLAIAYCMLHAYLARPRYGLPLVTLVVAVGIIWLAYWLRTSKAGKAS